MKVGLENRESSAETLLRHENGHLKKLVADLSTANEVLKEHLEGPALGKTTEGVREADAGAGIRSLSRAARFSGPVRHGLYYHPHPSSPRPRRPDDRRARAPVRPMSLNHVAYGHRRV